MPLELADFPAYVQVAFFIYDFLDDVWAGMSGTYLGKNWGSVEYLFNLYEVEDQKQILYIMKLYENINVGYRHQKAKEEEEKQKRQKASGGEKNFTHNVKG